uniref:Uncharacterized protein n=1 Tax=Octactis speculum TaxID=3111310 RepID=A0A7S2MED7_9STRA
MNQPTRVFLLVSSLVFSTTNSFTVQRRITRLDHRISKLEDFIMDDFRGIDMPVSIQDDLNLQPLMNQLEDLRNQRQLEDLRNQLPYRVNVQLDRAERARLRAERNEGRGIRSLRQLENHERQLENLERQLENFIMSDFRGIDMPVSIQDDLNLQHLLNQLEDIRNQGVRIETGKRDVRAKLEVKRAEGNGGRRVRPLRIVRRTPGRAFGAVKRVIPKKKKRVAVIAGIAVASVRFSARI